MTGAPGRRGRPREADGLLTPWLASLLGPEAVAEYRREMAQLVIPDDPAERKAWVEALAAELRARQAARRR